MLVALFNYGARAMVCLPWVACKQAKGFMSLMEGVVWPIQLDILTCYAVGAQWQGSRAFVHCVGALLRLISLWLVRHAGVLPKVIQGPCFVSRDNIYMGTCPKCHLLDASLSLLWQCWYHHLVTHSILLNSKVFYGHRFICIMLCLSYFSFRCLHGEGRYTTDTTRVGVTLDYVVVSNHSLTRTIAHCLYFLNCHGALVCLVGSMT